MARTRADIERDLATARRHANEPCNSFEDRWVERDIVKKYEYELSNYKDPEPYDWSWNKEEKPKLKAKAAPLTKIHKHEIEYIDDEEDIAFMEDEGCCIHCEESLDWQSGCYDADYSAYCSCGRWIGFVDNSNEFVRLILSKGQTFFN